MSATVLSFDVVKLVWYCLSGFSLLPIILQIGGQNWLVYILCISSWVSCEGPPSIRIDNKLGEYPSCIGSVECYCLRWENIRPLEPYSLCVNILWLSCVSCQVGSPTSQCWWFGGWIMWLRKVRQKSLGFWLCGYSKWFVGILFCLYKAMRIVSDVWTVLLK